MANRPEPEIEISESLVRTLLRDQFPALAGLRLQEFARGWDNTNFLLGDDAIVRLPHRQVAAQLLVNEQTWLPVLRQQLDIAIPAPTHAGIPTTTYPWAWSITPFFPGAEAAGQELSDPTRTAATLGTFFAQLHTPAPPNAPVNQFRGCPLADRSASFFSNLDRIDNRFDQTGIAAIFQTACDVPPTTERVWLHGDLHLRNMVVADGDLTAVIDWGDICAGDRATDLAGAFMLVPDQIEAVAEHAGADEATWQRARGWAANFAVIYLAHSDDEPVMANIGADLLATLLP